MIKYSFNRSYLKKNEVLHLFLYSLQSMKWYLFDFLLLFSMLHFVAWSTKLSVPRQLHYDAVFAPGFGKSLGTKYKKINSFARPNLLEFDTEMTRKSFSFEL